MQLDVAKAQAGTLMEWAKDWEREATGVPNRGAGEVAFLLWRAATALQRASGMEDDEIAGPSPVAPIAPAAEVREG